MESRPEDSFAVMVLMNCGSAVFIAGLLIRGREVAVPRPLRLNHLAEGASIENKLQEPVKSFLCNQYRIAFFCSSLLVLLFF